VAAADGYAQGAGRPAGNSVPGTGAGPRGQPVDRARKGRTPLVLVTGAIGDDQRDAPQWCGQTALAAACGVRFVSARGATGIDEAFAYARDERRPVVLEIPTATQLGEAAAAPARAVGAVPASAIGAAGRHEPRSDRPRPGRRAARSGPAAGAADRSRRHRCPSGARRPRRPGRRVAGLHALYGRAAGTGLPPTGHRHPCRGRRLRPSGKAARADCWRVRTADREYVAAAQEAIEASAPDTSRSRSKGCPTEPGREERRPAHAATHCSVMLLHVGSTPPASRSGSATPPSRRPRSIITLIGTETSGPSTATSMSGRLSGVDAVDSRSLGPLLRPIRP
jgi:hypothetical protein